MSTKIDIPICDIVGCDNMATQILNHEFNICERCNKERIRKINKKSKKEREEHKMDKIIETYLDLADTVQRAGGCVSVIKDHRDKPLSEFLEEVCSTNNIRFHHER